MAKDARSLATSLNALHEHSVTMGFAFNVGKCEVLAPTPVQVTLGGEAIRQSQSFKYLGVDMLPSGIDGLGLMQRNLAKARQTLGYFIRIGFRAGGLRERTKTLAYKLFIRPQLEYGVAIIPHSAAIAVKLDQFQYLALRTMLSLAQGYPYATLRALSGCPSMKERIGEIRARWFLRAERCSDADFMIGLAYKAYRSRPMSSSTFWVAEKLPLILTTRQQRLTTTSKVHPLGKE